MRHVHAYLPAARLEGQTLADSVVLNFEDRRRRRGTVTTLGGETVLIDLAESPALAHGDAFVVTDGTLIEIVAEAEELHEIRGRDPAHLVRLAWHLGNRHLETEIGAKWLRIRRDHVIAEMLKGLGARVIAIEGPFQPEGGAYDHGGGHSHAHGHAHEHDHRHDHKHDHDHKHAHGQDHAHDHGHDHATCGHDHSHDHSHDHDHGHHLHDHDHGHKHR